jgi:hypothetical protein
MYRFILVAAAALCGATAAAQVADVGPNTAPRIEKGSTGPTFPVADALIATAPAPAGVNVGLDGKPAPGGVGVVDSENSDGTPAVTGASGATR